MTLAHIFMECEFKSSFREFKRMGEKEMETATIGNFWGIFLRKKQKNGRLAEGSGKQVLR